jgi:hypothetical protein
MPPKTKKSKSENEEADVEDLELALQEADEQVQKKAVKPNEEERKALSLFCEKSLKCKEKQVEIKNSVKQMKVQVADLRKALHQAMKLSGKECFVIPKLMLRKAEHEAQKKKFIMPPAYLRMKTNSKDLSITDEVISEAVDSLSDQDIADQEMLSGKSALSKAIIDIVRRNIREYKEQFVMSPSIPRGVRHVDIDDADEDCAQMAIELFFLQQTIAEKESGGKSDLTELKQVMKLVEPKVDQFFVRGNFTSQRVQLGELPYTLVRRVAQSKPRMNFKMLESMVSQGVDDIFAHTKTKKDTKEDAVKLVMNSNAREDLKRLLLSRFAAIPSTTKVSIHLKSLNEKDDENENENEDENENES